jgi:FkbM family methyltransferase
MSSALSSFLKKGLFRRNRNLVSLDEPYRVMARLLRGSKVTGMIDAGASHGRISRRLLHQFPAADVYAFEPNPLYEETLREYAKREPRFHPQFTALSDHTGRGSLHITESPGAASLLTPTDRLRRVAAEGAAMRTVHEVEMTTIDEWVKHNGNRSIELMKFDIQGAELQALRGAVGVLRASALLVYTEIWFNAVYNGAALYTEIDAFLRTHGFVLYDFFKPKYEASGLIVWGNAIFINTERMPM